MSWPGRARSPAALLLSAALLAGCGARVGAEEPEPPRLEAEGVRLRTADGVDARAERLSAESPDAVRAEGVQVEALGEAPLRVSAALTEWDMRSRRAVFTGEVQVQRGPFSLRCERLELAHGEGGRVERALAHGAVQVQRPPWSARSREATLEMATGLLVLSGDPSVDDGQSVLAGERIELQLDDERMRCEGCSLVVPDPLDAPPGRR
ncbi:MAG: hypothetical protein H6741_07420 [Alphaproteobacteria bacterium]|nr:hypothetical protein [Alphaproteobacteria bacterium]MCB9792544.1 hypothetical protein [Alphaproteobacteria bacterium]